MKTTTTTATDTRPRNAAPLVINFGGGVDSTAILVGLVARGLRPDLILFADTGAEVPETYRWVDTFSKWLVAQGFPAVTVVGVRTVRAPYSTIEGNCLANSTLPSLAFGRGSCSSRWKAEPMDRWLSSWTPAIEAWERGEKITKAIGYDCGPADSKRVVKADKLPDDPKVAFWYPLRDWGWDREECLRQIEAAIGEVPQKSACFFCPGSKECELRALAENHPQLFRRAIRLEDKAQPNLQKVEGLWRTSTKTRPGSWRAFAEANGLPLPEEDENLPQIEEIQLAEVTADRETRKAAGEKLSAMPVAITSEELLERHGLEAADQIEAPEVVQAVVEIDAAVVIVDLSSDSLDSSWTKQDLAPILTPMETTTTTAAAHANALHTLDARRIQLVHGLCTADQYEEARLELKANPNPANFTTLSDSCFAAIAKRHSELGNIAPERRWLWACQGWGLELFKARHVQSIANEIEGRTSKAKV